MLVIWLFIFYLHKNFYQPFIKIVSSSFFFQWTIIVIIYLKINKLQLILFNQALKYITRNKSQKLKIKKNKKLLNFKVYFQKINIIKSSFEVYFNYY